MTPYVCEHALPVRPAEPFTFDQCRPCWLAANPNGAGAPAQNSEPGPCRHLDEFPLERTACGSCPTKWVYPCDVFGRCSPEGHLPGVKRCGACEHRAGRASDAPEPKPRRLILHNEACPGDVMVMEAAVASLHRAHPGAFVTAVTGTAADLFDFHPHVVGVEPDLGPWQTIKMEYPLVDRCDEAPHHFMAGYCDHLATVLGVPVPLTSNRPRAYLSPEERAWLPQVHEELGGRPRYWLVNAGRKDDYTAKWWGTANFQRVVDLLRGRVLFVQIGETGHHHPALAGALDMRGKTDTRQLVRMAFHAAGGLGPSTFLQHLCAAVDRPYVCVAGGREPHAWQHYPRQATLSNLGAVPCAASRAARACWVDRAAPDPEKPQATLCELPVLTSGGEVVPACLEAIRPERVAEEILARYNLGTASMS